MRRWVRRFLGIGATTWMGLVMAVVIAAQPPGLDDCGVMVQQALVAAGDACAGTGRNQVCYGNLLGAITPQDAVSAPEWDSVGDIADLTDVQTIDLSPLNPDTNEWGVAVMQVQASLPDSLPGQNVTMLMFGDVEIEDAVDDPVRLEAATLAPANIRLSPTTSGIVIGSLPAGTPVVVTGQTLNAKGEIWVRLKYEDYRTRTGWTFSGLVSADLALLPEVAADSLVYNPMQAFYFKTGLGSPQCAEVPTDGVMVQTPEGAGLINLNVNGVHVSLGSTAFLNTTRPSEAAPDTPQALQVTLFEGQGVITSEGVTRVLVPGSQTEVILDEQGQAAGIPSRPEPYDAEQFSIYDTQLESQGVELPAPADDAEIEAQNPTSDDDSRFDLPVCEDTDADGTCDTCRDRNQNGVCDGLECVDVDGDGTCEGCRDGNGNGVCDYQECLDSDDDGVCDMFCYDLNNNDVCDGQENECNDRNNNGICDRDECLDADGDGVCEQNCIDSDGNRLCDLAECKADPTLPICQVEGCTDADADGICDAIDPAICLAGDTRPVCTGCEDRNDDEICDIDQCIDKDGDGDCDCKDVNQNGICDGQE